MRLRSTLTLSIAALLTTFAPQALGKRNIERLDLQPLPPAACGAPRGWVLGEPLDQKAVNGHAVVLDDPSVQYVQLDGGSAATTLLLGPVGMAINSASIKSRTAKQADAIAETDVVSPRDLVAELMPANDATGTAASPVIVRPLLLHVRPRKSTTVERRLLLDLTCDGWRGWYSVHLAPVDHAALSAGMTVEEAAVWNASLRTAATQLIALFQSDARGEAGDVTAMNIASSQLNPFFKAAIPQGLRGTFDGRSVVVGQGEIDAGSMKAMLSFMKGVHLMDADRLDVGKPW